MSTSSSADRRQARTIVVGYDGSPASRAAVDEAIRRVGDGKLIVVHAYHVPADFVGAPYYQDAMNEVADRGAALLDELEQSCPALATVDYEPDVIGGTPAEAICRVAGHRRADEIIVGTRGLGRVRALLGSVAHEVIHGARCPVVVIPERIVEDGRHSAQRTTSTA